VFGEPLWGAFFPEKLHNRPKVAIDILDVPFSRGDILVAKYPLNSLGADFVRVG
jgi:hypothetical protein